MKKVFVLFLSGIVVITGVFASCSKETEDNTSSQGETVQQGLEANADEVEIVAETVTDENGEPVTDEDGNVVTTVVAKPVDDSNDSKDSDDSDNAGENIEEDTLATNPTEEETATTKPGVSMTESAKTTEFTGKETVPSLSDTGKEVNFSEKDILIVQSMLEVPYLYTASYENAEGVPIEIATHVAIWMAEHEGSTRKTYPSSPVVLNLFKYFGQTVVNFKTKCNDANKDTDTPAPITYNKNEDTFTISEFTSKKQDVTITKIEDLGDNNFYKVTGSVTGCNKKKVVAIIQKNRLDTSLGFSVKALKWS